MELIDTHVHLTMPEYSNQPGGIGGVIDRAKQAGVTAFIIPGLDSNHCTKAQTIAHTYSNVYFAVGQHPTAPNQEFTYFTNAIKHPKCVAIGEIGLDSKSGRVEVQETRFRHFLDLAVAHHKPVILHIRDLWADTWRVLSDYPQLRNRLVVHCFTGGPAETEQMEKLGILMSVTAILARKNILPETLEAVASWPLEQMMLETDGPWLPFPGEPYPNEPATVAKICQFVADLKNISSDQVAVSTTQTAKDFFGL